MGAGELKMMPCGRARCAPGSDRQKGYFDRGLMGEERGDGR